MDRRKNRNPWKLTKSLCVPTFVAIGAMAPGACMEEPIYICPPGGCRPQDAGEEDSSTDDSGADD